MEYIKTAAEIVAILGFLGSAVGVFGKVLKDLRKIRDAQKCNLRAGMLRTYYRNKDQKKIRQFELQNFLLMYQAYKALGGNSFIDEVYEAVTSWEIIT